MSEVNRYGFKEHLGLILSVERQDGNYVTYQDYSEIKAQRDALASENAAMKSLVREVAESSEECEFNGDEHRYVIVPESFDALTDLLQETPATDAILSSVRAEGVEMVAESLIQNGVCTSSHTVGYFKQFAAQLRGR